MVGHDRGDGASAPGRPRNSDDDPKLTRPSSGNHRGPTVVISMTGTAWDPGAQPTQMALRTCERAVRSFRERGADGACFGSRALWRAPRIDACGLGDYSTSDLLYKIPLMAHSSLITDFQSEAPGVICPA